MNHVDHIANAVAYRHKRSLHRQSVRRERRFLGAGLVLLGMGCGCAAWIWFAEIGRHLK